MKFLTRLVVILGITLSGCSSTLARNINNQTAQNSDNFPEIVFTNGFIYTVNEEQPQAEAMYIADGEIQYVGNNENALELASDRAKIIDLKGKMMMPGIHDVHVHPLEASSELFSCFLDSDVADVEDYIPILEDCPAEQIGTNWILGGGHSVFTLLDSDRPPIEILDEVIPDRPVLLMEETSHSMWVNSKALEVAGIDENTPNPPGGVIVRDRAGNPTGILFDSAGDLVMDLAWKATPEIKQLNYDGLLESLALLNEYGITSIADARTYWKREFQDAWLQAENDNTLTIRAVLGLWAYPSVNDETQLAKLKSLYRKNPDDLLQISQIKVYADGILINTTAAMLEPYREVLGDIPSKNGLNYFTQTRLTEYIRQLEAVGFDFHIHAIGDRGVREALNAIETGGSDRGRHRLTHLEIVNPRDYSRFQALNVTADMQVSGDFTHPEHWPENEPLIGDRANNLVPLKDLYEANARIVLSSDWDVSTLNPFVGMQNALTRSPQNLPDLATVIQAYTLNAAYVLRQEDRVGSLEVGKKADAIVLDRNLFEIPTRQISKTKVLMTFVDGKLVYKR